MSEFEIRDPRMGGLVLAYAQLDHLWTGGRWLEGPAYLAAGRYLVFSDIPNDRMMRYDETNGMVSVFRGPSDNSNGNTVDQEGRLVTCEHRTRRVTRTEPDGSVVSLASHYEGRRLNSPNDVVVKSDGSLWFSDPTYGIDTDYEGDAAPSELGRQCVYRLDPRTGALAAVATDRVQPNGLAFSPDETTLYVSDTGASHVADHPRSLTAYDVLPDDSLANPRTFAVLEEGFFDGLRCDVFGNVWTSAFRSARCYAPDGTHLGTLPMPERVSNLCFGGRKRNRLFITAHTSLYAIYVNTRGAIRPPARRP
ncbi:SMP-30/gluconolactonase/LRE family protein [Ancylobacter oerskovii]|uniref:SMP-30/gluconolactonase/LRE family protein n=1 Tax=Ancylobacter oerskovii TaxID=459519 RepID=A0ABW4YYG3_9HYPH|nr:SMP-30/gluconolactonase/LRE family protein [Ancylobacter oerskovii]MBS7541635.1 SMP-30/gluconolactonase/LRE family protein [Ancylobacter oerskovii]